MKLINSLEKHYQRQYKINEELKKTVDDHLNGKLKKEWNCFSRIKSKESYALKMETGRVSSTPNLKDFFACIIVVQKIDDIKSVIEKIKAFCDIEDQKPETEKFTHKSPDAFPYDDLRLYVKLKYEERLPHDNIHNELSVIIFEIQIKTPLQYAWYTVSHDLIYKGDAIDWSKQRIVYQIKAMLEHIEISIDKIEDTKSSSLLKKSNKKFEQLNKTLKFLKEHWKEELLPKDLIRLSHNVNSLLTHLDITISNLEKMLENETCVGRGIHTVNLSPYFTIIQTIINQNPEKLQSYSSEEYKIILPPEINTKDSKIDRKQFVQFG